MKKEELDYYNGKSKNQIIIKYVSGEPILDKKLKFICRIYNDGTKMVQFNEHPIILGKTTFTIHGLSMTYKRYIATDGMSTYVVELEDHNLPVNDEKKDKVISLLNEAKIQIEYLHDKLGTKTGTGNNILSKINKFIEDNGNKRTTTRKISKSK